MDARRQKFTRLALAFCIVGVLLRLLQFMAKRSLWLDEAMLSINIASRNFFELLHDLDYGQVAPVLFLWLERLAFLVGGPDEWVLRALSFVAGVALPWITWLLARRFVGPGWSAFSALVVAVSPFLIRYSNEVKPYASDGVIAAVVILSVLVVANNPRRPFTWWILVLVGLVASFLSISCVFVLACTAPALLLHEQIRQDRRLLIRVVLCTLSWLAPFIVLYVTVYRAPSDSAYVQLYWGEAFVTAQTAWPIGRELISSLLVGTLSPSGWGPVVRIGVGIQAFAGMVLCGLGVLVLARKREYPELVILAGPIVVAAAASALALYPISPRLTIFLVPGIVLLLTVGIAAASRRSRIGAAAIVAFLVLPAFARAVLEAVAPHHRQEVRPLVGELRNRAHLSEPVYVSVEALPAWIFYTTDWSRPNIDRLRWFASNAGSGGLAFHSRTARGWRMANEGGELHRVDGLLPEVIGVATGRRHAADHGFFFVDETDEGWATNESNRIAQYARPSAWVLYVNESFGYNDPALQLLISELEKRGGRLTYRSSAQDADLLRVEFKDVKQ